MPMGRRKRKEKNEENEVNIFKTTYNDWR